MDRLRGKCALITGGTSGIGLETARQFLAEGARVAVTGNGVDTIEAARHALGPDVLVLNVDAGDVSAQKGLAHVIDEAFGRLDAAFINAGSGALRPLEAWDEASFDRLLAVNLKGPYFLVQALLPLMANPGSIVFNASMAAHMGMPNTSVYAATKAGLISLAQTLSGELIARGIRVNAVSPGPIQTPIFTKLGLTPEQLQEVAAYTLSRIPAGRFGDPADIAKAVVFLASDESVFAVGSEFVIDGGMSRL